MKKVIFFLLFLLITPIILVSSVFAQEFRSSESVELSRGEVINGDFFAAGETVNISGTVNGDAYIAGGNVLIDGNINGDLLLAGGNVTIRGRVKNDVRAAGGSLTISGNIDGNTTVAGGNIYISEDAKLLGSLVAGTGNLQIFAPIGKGATIGAGQALIGNSIGGNIMAGVGKLSLAADARVDGDLSYWSEEKADISTDASVSGRVTQHIYQRPVNEVSQKAARDIINGASFGLKIIDVILSILVGLLLIRFFPIYSEGVQKIIHSSYWKSMLIGFLTLILSPFLILILLITLIGIPFAILWTVCIFILIFLSKIFVALVIGQQAAKMLKQNYPNVILLLGGLVIYSFVTWIPVLGGIIAFLTMLTGMGAMLWQKKILYSSLREKKLL